jgi:RNA polymerase sigma-70 factor (ECF subfamily)
VQESAPTVVSAQQYQDFQDEALIHNDALYRYARRLTMDTREAEDLLQETFLRALRFWHQYQKGTNCKAWLFRIMRNLSINRAQSKARSPVKDSLEDTEEWSLFGKLKDKDELSNESPEKMFFTHNWSPEIVNAMAKLPEEYRSAIILCDVEGFAYQEIADILEIPIGTVRSRLNRARSKLQSLLLEYVKEHHPDLLKKSPESP